MIQVLIFVVNEKALKLMLMTLILGMIHRSFIIFTPRACARGKARMSVVVVLVIVVVGTKVARSHVLGICARCIKA